MDLEQSLEELRVEHTPGHEELCQFNATFCFRSFKKSVKLSSKLRKTPFFFNV